MNQTRPSPYLEVGIDLSKDMLDVAMDGTLSICQIPSDYALFGVVTKK